jgi:hypothetical protein
LFALEAAAVVVGVIPQHRLQPCLAAVAAVARLSLAQHILLLILAQLNHILLLRRERREQQRVEMVDKAAVLRLAGTSWPQFNMVMVVAVGLAALRLPHLAEAAALVLLERAEMLLAQQQAQQVQMAA